MTEMTSIEKFEKEEEKFDAEERIGEFLGVNDFAHLPIDLDNNHHILYGKFDPINLDDFGNTFIAVLQGKKQYNNKKIQSAIDVLSRATAKALLNRVHPYETTAYGAKSSHRIAFYAINLRLSELGIPPRWRKLKKPLFKKDGKWSDEESRYMRDLQVFDMEWLYRQYPKHRVMSGYGELIKKLKDGDSFDFALAHMIAAADFTATTKAKMFKLTEDMQAEMCVLRDKRLDREYNTLMRQLDEVESDLVLAASRNPRRGKKLLDVLDDRLCLWLSVMMTKGNSETKMIENYCKLTGDQINRSTYKSRIKSLNSALMEVGSKYSFAA